ncbi:ATP-binding protein [Methylobacterium sp. Leaf361]|uniref:ATP-binding protein n=1 Tax=Methylobacterium sp. Leaf361 TaxID=1736352 RepID=UPI000B1E830A|nr:ATP-binding protein [Methylobacterium sp. Leaf361]
MVNPKAEFKNPFRPGAGHMPPYLAGREAEEAEFRRLLAQDTILENLILTGLRGLGKTVLLEKFKPIAIQEGWIWVGTDLSETSSVSEANLATRIITDLSLVTSSLTLTVGEQKEAGFTGGASPILQPINYQYLMRLYEETPGLTTDKLKAVLEFAWTIVQQLGKRGMIFAYDEAQNLADHAQRDQYPLSVLLDTFQSIQRKNISFMLALVGLPTLFPKLVEARTYSERMFRVVSLSQLEMKDRKDAIKKPVEDAKCPVKFTEPSVDLVATTSGGYPYFIQFICREIYDVWIQRLAVGADPSIPIDEIMRKLDTDFFAGRWGRATDRQRDLLFVIANLENADGEFTVQEIVEASHVLSMKGFGSSHVNQMLSTLNSSGVIYKNRHGKYSFAVPMMASFIRRQNETPSPPANDFS